MSGAGAMPLPLALGTESVEMISAGARFSVIARSTARGHFVDGNTIHLGEFASGRLLDIGALASHVRVPNSPGSFDKSVPGLR